MAKAIRQVGLDTHPEAEYDPILYAATSVYAEYSRKSHKLSATEMAALARQLVKTFGLLTDEEVYADDKRGDALYTRQEMIGRQFGYLQVLRQEGKSKKNILCYDCQCVCGKVVSVDGYKLRAGIRKSCGCKQGAGKKVGRK